MACLHAINETGERGWLAEFYRGGRLLHLRRVPQCRDVRPQAGEYHEWPDDAAQRAEWLAYAELHHHAHDHKHVWRPFLREKIRGFTMRSRMRLLDKINSVASKEAPPLPKFVTLTYPRELLPSGAWAKRQLHAFLMWMFKAYGRFPVLWRLEYQEDGAIHFHLMCWYTPFLPWWKVAEAWDRLIGNQVTPRESASTQVKAMKSWKQTSAYISKYIAKDSEEGYWDQQNGRHWGARNWDLMPVHRILLPLTEREGYAWRRWVRRYRIARGVRTRGFGETPRYCGTREIGIRMFLSDKDVVRLAVLTRGASPLGSRPTR